MQDRVEAEGINSLVIKCQEMEQVENQLVAMRDWCALLFENTSSLMLNLLIRLCFLVRSITSHAKMIPPQYIKHLISKYSGGPQEAQVSSRKSPTKKDSGINKDLA